MGLKGVVRWRWRWSDHRTTLVKSSESTVESGLRSKGWMSGCVTIKTWRWIGDQCRRLSRGEAVTRSVVGWRWLIVYLVECTGWRTIALRSAVRFRSILHTGYLITLDLDGLLRFDQVLVQLLKCGVLHVNLVIQLGNVLKHELLLRLSVAESRLVLGEIIMHVFFRLVQVRDFAVFD